MKSFRLLTVLAALSMVFCPLAIGQEYEPETLEWIKQDTHKILNNTEPRFLQKGGWGTFSDILALIASGTAIIAIGGAFLAYKKRIRDKKCQEKLLEDIIRYLYTTDVIIEVIRQKMELRNWKAVPNSTIINRFAFMEEDLKISHYTNTAKNYNIFHEFCLFLRNYNSMVESVSAHFQDINLDPEIKKRDLTELQFRSARIIARIYCIAKDMHLKIKSVDTILLETYTSKPASENAGKKCQHVDYPRFSNNKILTELGEKRAQLDNYIVDGMLVFYQGLDYSRDVYNRGNVAYDIVLYPLDAQELRRQPGMDLVDAVKDSSLRSE
ncbi:MAG: hypothetical protein J6X71_03790 [Bacteroidales bacterium]|nr:hypothetical protein [Bacteroidales bacterium]